MKVSYTKLQIEFLLMLRTRFGNIDRVTRKNFCVVASDLGYRVIPVWITSDKSRSDSRGVFMFPELLGNAIESLVVKEESRGRPRKYSNMTQKI